jgi:predicted nucleic acid-binding Zn ribbon protein
MKKGYSGHLRGAIDGLLNKLEKRTARKGSAVIDAWRKAAGPGADGHSRPVSFKKGVLVIVVENSTWLYKLTLDKRNILKRFNDAYTGRTQAEDIRFRVGTFGD